ncbi:MAG: redox-sensing transcriptional repressor Rex [Firmicutes bacterium]|nr:redox-sensing transcriptional repressor Rex [Bacillota bacterium]
MVRNKGGKYKHEYKQKAIPLTVVKRLPVYQRLLAELAARDVERVSSRELATQMKIDPSQVRQDLSLFGSFGQQGYGYRVRYLLNELNKILGLNTGTKLVLVGGGHLGRAIANYGNFVKWGFTIKAIFDRDPQVIGLTIAGLTVRDVRELTPYLRAEPVEIGIICTPAPVAQEVADQLVAGGIKGIWNFAPVALRVPETVCVEHVHLGESLMTLSFMLKQRQEESTGPKK